jgi:hypothetical protein
VIYDGERKTKDQSAMRKFENSAQPQTRQRVQPHTSRKLKTTQRAARLVRKQQNKNKRRRTCARRKRLKNGQGPAELIASMQSDTNKKGNVHMNVYNAVLHAAEKQPRTNKVFTRKTKATKSIKFEKFEKRRPTNLIWR